MEAGEGVDGESVEVTSDQPRSPDRPAQRQSSQHSALQAAEQQIQLIHEEYKKILREKQVQFT